MNKTLYFFLLTFAVGLLLGIFTSFGQTFIPEPFKQLANSYSVWLSFSFIAGYLLVSYKKAAVAGVLLQYLAIIFYYVASSLRFDMGFSFGSLISLNLVWIAGGTVAGPIAALAGAMARKKAKYVSYAIGFMAGLFISEALYQLIILGYVGEGTVFSVVALVFLGVSYYKIKYSVVKTALATLFFASLMYVGYAYVLKALFS